MKATHYVVSYDIESDRRRTKIAKTLEDFGQRVQFSVFECRLNPKDLVRMQERVEELINRKTDSLIIYRLCESCTPEIYRVGVKKTLDRSDYIV
jgi:CRISPR-associated protein Cas2